MGKCIGNPTNTVVCPFPLPHAREGQGESSLSNRGLSVSHVLNPPAKVGTSSGLKP
jgi:hypothetical protein